MTAPQLGIDGVPPDAVSAVMVVWDDDAGKFIPASQTLFTGSITTSPTTSVITSISPSISSASVLPAESDRKGATIANDTSQPVFVAFSDAASLAAYTVKIAAGGVYTLPVMAGGVYTGAITAIWPLVATGSLLVTELT